MDISKLAEAFASGAEIIKIAYVDIAQPGAKQIGLALETSLGLINTLLLPLKFLNKSAKANFDYNIKKYTERLSEISEDKIYDVPPQLGLPILEKFTVTSDEDLSELFVNLLLSASNKDSISETHPSFIQLIERMSPDEGRILNYLKNSNVIPFIKLKAFTKDNKSSYSVVFERYTGLNNFIELTFPENLNMYIENFISMGIIEDRGTHALTDFNNYSKLLHTLMSLNLNCPKCNDIEYDDGLFVQRGFLQITELGHKFIKSCTAKTKNEYNKDYIFQIYQNIYGFNIDDEIFHKKPNGGQIGKILLLGSENKICVHFGDDTIKILSDYTSIEKNPYPKMTDFLNN